ncbi:hypothetical protein HYC85_004281 [Camellia sinensis]|uniref:Uncharacterized protein n=1 Tax=Camellia sinensis TaxID=4442 RepID=A0A7J7HY45_CAMSI|nr:hypothetical protein HYC85_004281 [Camellia sinensis]
MSYFDEDVGSLHQVDTSLFCFQKIQASVSSANQSGILPEWSMFSYSKLCISSS